MVRRTLERISRRQIAIFLVLGAIGILLYTLFSGAEHKPTARWPIGATIAPTISNPVIVVVPKKVPVKVPQKTVKVVPPPVIEIAMSTATSTATSTPAVIAVATTTPTTTLPIVVASTTPTTTPTLPPFLPNSGGIPSVSYFTSGTPGLTLTIDECSSSLSPTSCRVAAALVTLSWSSLVEAIRYAIWINGVASTTLAGTNSTLILDDQATTSLKIVAYDAHDSTRESPPLEVRVELPITHSSVHDDFNSYNTAGWQTFGGSVKDFENDDDPGTNCFLGACIVGSANNTFSASVPRIYLELPPALPASALSVYAKARSGSLTTPNAIISICKESSNCADGSRIDFSSLVPLDDTWHQYYFAWRQGTAHIETCIQSDDLNAAHCVWTDTAVALGTKFDGVALWSGNGYRADLGANLWFDELEAR